MLHPLKVSVGFSCGELQNGSGGTFLRVLAENLRSHRPLKLPGLLSLVLGTVTAPHAETLRRKLEKAIQPASALNRLSPDVTLKMLVHLTNPELCLAFFDSKQDHIFRDPYRNHYQTKQSQLRKTRQAPRDPSHS